MLGATLLGLLVLHTPPLGAFNLAPTLIFKGDANQPGDYFGYSVALQRRTSPYGHWVIVGAPRANSSTQRAVVEPGAAYECNTDTTDCAPIDLGNLGDSGDQDSDLSTIVYKSKKDNAWIGGAIDVQDQNDGRIVVCGPRSVNHSFNRTADPNDGIYRIIGVCVVKDFVRSSSDVERLTPLYDRAKFTVNLEVSKPGLNSTKSSRAHFYELGAAGSSVHFSEESNELLIGAPGVLQWRGTMIRYMSKRSLSINPDNGRDTKMYGSPMIPHPEKTPKLTDDGYFGYSVDSGTLYKRNSTSFVGGAPRGGALKGKVYVFNFPDPGRSNYSEFKVLAEIEGTQMGEYFGASVCAVDLNGDGLDDLVVGAPMYTVPLNYPSQSTSSEGRVYVFINGGQGIFTVTKNSILGSHINGRFGSAISKIGDVNIDGFNDIAVGAPYAHVDGNGAIYIYHGGSSGVSSKHRQLITAESVSTGLSGFGISISRGLDVDDNGYNDIAVGAYTSGHVVLLTSRNVVTLRPSLGVKNSSGDSNNIHLIDKNATSFVVIACMDYSGVVVSDAVYVRIKLTADPRTRFVDEDRRSKTTEFNTVLKRNTTKCKDVAVEITKRDNFPIPLEIRMNFQLDASKAENNSLGFCSSCPVVDPDVLDYAVWSIPFVTERTDLKIQVDFADPKMIVVLGTQPRVPMKITVTNKGQPAFQTTIKVTLPPNTSLLEFGGSRWMKHQNTTYTTLECDLQDVYSDDIKAEDLWVILDTVGVKEGTQSMLFSFEVVSTGDEQHPSDNMETVSLATRMEADVFITAISNQIHEKISAADRQNFSHTYIVKSFGPSALGVLKLTFHLPTVLKTLDGELQLVSVYKPELTLDNQPFQCTLAKGPDFFPDENKGAVKTIQLSSLKKRSTSANLDEEYDVTKFPAERSLVVNCLTDNAQCLMVECLAGPFVPNRSTAIISFRMEVDFKGIEPILAERDILVISSTGRATILTEGVTQPLDHRPDVTSAKTLFFGEGPSPHLDETIVYASIAGGVLILIIIIVIFWKVGFFKRPKKEELTAQQNVVNL